MAADVKIERFSPRYAEQIFDLIVPIQTHEFGIKITREGQPDLAQIPEFYQQGNGNFWVATIRDDVVGSIGLKDIGEKQAALRKMFVRASHRGKDKGVAQRLLDESLAWARSRKLSDIYLGTTAQFVAAHRFYEKNNFTEVDKAFLPANFPVMAVDSKFYRFQLDD